MINKETMKKQIELTSYFFLQCYVWGPAEIVGKSGEIHLGLTRQPIP